MSASDLKMDNFGEASKSTPLTFCQVQNKKFTSFQGDLGAGANGKCFALKSKASF